MHFNLSPYPSEEEQRELATLRLEQGENDEIILREGRFMLATCEICGAKFEARISGLTRRYPPFCRMCRKREEEEREYRRREEAAQVEHIHRQQLFYAAIPPIYRVSDLTRLPAAGLAAVDAYGPDDLAAGIGLGLVGPAGAGKTRCMGQLIGRLCLEHGLLVRAVAATEFSHRVSTLAFDRVAKLESYLKELSTVPVLFVDDVGKGRLTDRVEAEFYYLLERRTAYGKPTLWTSNSNAAALLRLFSADRGEPIVRRLAEFSHVVNIIARGEETRR